MDGFSKIFVTKRRKQQRSCLVFSYFITIFIVVTPLINSCDALFYSEKQTDFDNDRNCFCEVNINIYFAQWVMPLCTSFYCCFSQPNVYKCESSDFLFSFHALIKYCVVLICFFVSFSTTSSKVRSTIAAVA